MKGKYVPGCVKEIRNPSWASNSILTPLNFGVDRYLLGNMPAVNVLNVRDNEGVGEIYREGNISQRRYPFAARRIEGEIRHTQSVSYTPDRSSTFMAELI
jgi:hypothetical protein